jgi:hypothetical protein
MLPFPFGVCTEIPNITQTQKYLILNDSLKKIRRQDDLSHGFRSEKDRDCVLVYGLE